MGYRRLLPQARLMEREPQAAVNPEPHWPGAVAMLAAASLNLFLPEALSAGPGWIAVALVGTLALCATLLPKWHTWLGHATAAIATVALAQVLIVLIVDLAHHRGRPDDLLQAAVILWSMNIAVFASWYWRLDAGGPHHRSRHRVYCGGAFLFPQLTLSTDVRRAVGAEDWKPRFVDYLFLAFNTSTAFSPTDVPVLSPWAKVLMMVQSSIALATLAMVAARAVNIL